MGIENQGSAADLLSSLSEGSFQEPAATEQPDTATVNTGTEEDAGNSGDDIDGIVNEIAPEPPPSFTKLKVKADKGEHEFELSPDNEELKKTLSLGVMARRLQAERDQLKKQIDKFKDYDSVQKEASTLKEINELASKGYTTQAVKALLGDKYDEFRRAEILGAIEYESASPEDRFNIDRQRIAKEKELSEWQKNKRIEELEKRMQEREEAIEFDRWNTIGTQLMQKYSMENFVADKDQATKLNNLMYKAAWNEMAELPDHVEWTPSVFEKKLREQAMLLRGGMQKTAEAKVQQITEDKKKTAKEQAQGVVRRNQSTNTDGLADKLKGATSSLDKLNILLGRG